MTMLDLLPMKIESFSETVKLYLDLGFLIIFSNDNFNNFPFRLNLLAAGYASGSKPPDRSMISETFSLANLLHNYMTFVNSYINIVNNNINYLNSTNKNSYSGRLVILLYYVFNKYKNLYLLFFLFLILVYLILSIKI